MTVSPGAALGARTVVLTTGTEVAQLVGGFTVTPGQPTLFSINPVSAIQGTNLTVILNGAFTNFTPQVTTAFFGTGISVGPVTVNGPRWPRPNPVAAGATVGPRSVTVTTGSDRSRSSTALRSCRGRPRSRQSTPTPGSRASPGTWPSRACSRLAEHGRVGELRGRHHGELERRELGDLADQQHHD